jgi:hypothetical protein
MRGGRKIDAVFKSLRAERLLISLQCDANPTINAALSGVVFG